MALTELLALHNKARYGLISAAPMLALRNKARYETADSSERRL
jgi:hypothetical protein